MDPNGNPAEPAPPPQLTIQDLPNEMLLSILKWIEDERDLENVQHVSPLWYAVIDECVGREVAWTSSGVIYPRNSGEQQMKRRKRAVSISQVGIRKLTISCTTVDSSVFPSLKYPHLLKSLSLLRAPHPDIFSSLVAIEVMANMDTFRFTHDAIKRVRREELEYLDLNFPQLRRIIGGLDGFYDLESLPNLSLLFRDNYFPQLGHLSINVPISTRTVPDSEEEPILRVLLQFIQAHPGLKELEMTVDSPEPIRPSERDILPGSNWEEIVTELKDINVKSSRGSLKILNLKGKNMFLCPGRSHPQLDPLKRILLWPSSLQELELEMALISNEILEVLCSRNGATLKKVIINQSTISPVEILNLGVFSGLHHPQKISLRGNQEVSGAIHLPPRLEFLVLKGKLRGEDIDHILLHLPNLHTVYLKIEETTQEGYDVRLDTLNKFVEERRVNKLRLYGIPSAYPPEGLSNGEPGNPIRLAFKSGMIFGLQLNEAGYYKKWS